jgi:hypothetical protein
MKTSKTKDVKEIDSKNSRYNLEKKNEKSESEN